MLRSKMIMAGLAGAALFLAGCGSDPGERALTGGLLGAGAATSPCTVDLNAPGGHRDCD